LLRYIFACFGDETASLSETDICWQIEIEADFGGDPMRLVNDKD
jgi:hypothetical protein